MINFLPRCEQNNYYKPSFQAYEKTFVMLKPDSFKRSLDGKIMESLCAWNADIRFRCSAAVLIISLGMCWMSMGLKSIRAGRYFMDIVMDAGGREDNEF